MNKLNLVNKLATREKITKEEARVIVDLFFGSMTEALSLGNRVEIRGLCSFFVKEYKSYLGRNPKTGKKTQIRAKKLPFFKCGRELKKRVDYESN